ncbi:gamma-glutamylcyclotransferase family protein [Celeribacter sp.]|uniref:gamma-glutamylcyclotransferase family protein n=1 Tax=Celeribacter sp. TaxID=1890673 RepID=UPI003A8D192C
MTEPTVQPGDYLFVYGTLMQAIEGNEMAQLLHANSTHIGTATMQGRLYKVSYYPGVIDSDLPNDIVHGDLFRLGDNAAKIMKRLDLYEDIGPPFEAPYEYRRVLRPVHHGDKAIQAWVYIYNWQLSEDARIPDGKFRA